MKLELKRIGVWSAIKVTFLLSLVIGFAVGILYALLIMMMMAIPMSQMPDDFPGISGMFVGGVMLVILPILMSIFMAIVNTVGAALAALIYNLVVKMIGGLELEFAEVKAVVMQPVARTATPPPPYEPPQPPPPRDPEGPSSNV
ncbi:MAG: DUF3566 domain-containing protein [bacterium]